MDKNFCRQIDKESLVEQYVAGKLRGDLLDKFEQHIKECEDHAQAVLLEKALKRGVSEFARSEMKIRLHNRLKKREDTRFMILRYAAVLLVAVITPLILYYQFNVAPEDMAESVVEAEKEILSEDADISQEEGKQKKVVTTTAPKTSQPVTLVEEQKPVQPAAPEGAGYNKPEEDIQMPVEEKQEKSPDEGEREISQEDVLTESSKIQDMLKAAGTTSTAKLEADFPPAQQPSVEKTNRGKTAYRTSSLQSPAAMNNSELNNKVLRDSLAFRECIDSMLTESERDKYKIDLNIQVLKSGKIGEIKIIQTTHQSPDLEDCLFNIIKKWNLSKDVNNRQIIQRIEYQ